MTVTFPLRCLFCSQLSPAEAIFCTGCDAQLDLQPCSHCDAVDSRNAVNCYKCGAPFAVASNAGEGPVLTLSGVDEMQVEQGQKLAYDRGAVSPVTRPRWLIPAATLIGLVAVGTLIFLSSAPYLTSPSGQKILAVQPVDPATPTLASPVEAKTAIKGMPNEIIVGETALDKINPVVPTGQAASATVRSTAAITNTGVSHRPDQSALEACPEAVATLGLCSPEIKKGDL